MKFIKREDHVNKILHADRIMKNKKTAAMQFEEEVNSSKDIPVEIKATLGEIITKYKSDAYQEFKSKIKTIVEQHLDSKNVFNKEK